MADGGNSLDAVELVTFGCRLNITESATMRAHAQAAGLGADGRRTLIFNTCAVTAAAEREARAAIRRARRDDPTARIVVTGCASQISSAAYASMAEVDHVLANDAKLQAESFLQLAGKDVANIQPAAIPATATVTGARVADLPVGSDTIHTRAFLSVQNGCDHRCTFCIIPYGRGASRSSSIADVVADGVALAARGYREITLTGVDIASYGADLPDRPTLGQAIRALLDAAPDLSRLRLSSLDPAAIDKDLWQLLADESRLMPHFHLSLQAGDDMVLKRMKRRHSRADVVALCARARALRPDIMFGADIIAGFPTETDTMFDNTLRLVEEAGLTWLHVFPYSARTGTPAAKMPQVPMDTRRDRAAQLRAAGQRMVDAHLQAQVGQMVEVLTEQHNQGHTRGFAPVQFIQDIAPNKLVMAQIRAVQDGKLLVEVTC